MLEARTYRAESIQAALLLAKAELGPDAVILDVRHLEPRRTRGCTGVACSPTRPGNAGNPVDPSGR
jgi:flagellar biosynthesis GTPase FlhF